MKVTTLALKYFSKLCQISLAPSGSRLCMAWYQTVSSVLRTQIILCYSKGSEPECRLQKQLPERGREGVLNKHFARVVWNRCVDLPPKNNKHRLHPIHPHLQRITLQKVCYSSVWSVPWKNLRREFFFVKQLQNTLSPYEMLQGHLLNSHLPNPTPPHFINEEVEFLPPPPPTRKKINSTDTVPPSKKKLRRPSQKNSEVYPVG